MREKKGKKRGKKSTEVLYSTTLSTMYSTIVQIWPFFELYWTGLYRPLREKNLDCTVQRNRVFVLGCTGILAINNCTGLDCIGWAMRIHWTGLYRPSFMQLYRNCSYRSCTMDCVQLYSRHPVQFLYWGHVQFLHWTPVQELYWDHRSTIQA